LIYLTGVFDCFKGDLDFDRGTTTYFLSLDTLFFPTLIFYTDYFGWTTRSDYFFYDFGDLAGVLLLPFLSSSFLERNYYYNAKGYYYYFGTYCLAADFLISYFTGV